MPAAMPWRVGIAALPLKTPADGIAPAEARGPPFAVRQGCATAEGGTRRTRKREARPSVSRSRTLLSNWTRHASKPKPSVYVLIAATRTCHRGNGDNQHSSCVHWPRHFGLFERQGAIGANARSACLAYPTIYSALLRAE